MAWGAHAPSHVAAGAHADRFLRPLYTSSGSIQAQRPCWEHISAAAKGLTLGAGGDMLLGQDGQIPFQFMFTWQMQRQPFEEVAISPEPGTVGPLCRERKMLASNNFRKPPHRFVRIHLAIVIHEQPVVY